MRAGTLMKPKAMMPTATTVTAARTTNWVQTRRVNRTISVRSPPVGGDQRVTRGVWARHLADGSAPLHFQFGEVAFPPRSGEQAGVQPAQREVDDQGDVCEVTTKPVGNGALRPRVRRQEVQTL